ncbi:hypothetical protein JRQ81_018847 [Phrynocephalus forsythii]|uniref:acid phosphatase n=1 Tax=Phrynocephalus forsythii TaxID=171643 RepID=A0A9Q0XQB4_9SAUR|nr:hypothetical protein JRQ81_018847 [Phrynocephalus forsythii]
MQTEKNPQAPLIQLSSTSVATPQCLILYVRSTDSDRTLMSALANLAGLYPPVGSQIWNPNLLWQPIPVHTVARCNEKLLAFPTRNCKRFYLLLKETMKSNNANSMMKSQMPFLAEIAGKMGYDVKTLLDFTNQKFWNAYDALLVQKIHGKPLPDWATEHNMCRMNLILAYAVEALFGVHKREEKSRLQGGVLVKEILEKFTKVAESAEKTKLTLYSAHDMTLVALHVALGIFQRQLPPYAACHFFELYKECNGEYTVEMYFRNSTTSAPFQFTLPGCSATCPLKKFKQLVSPIMPVNVEEEYLKALQKKAVFL